MMGKYYQKKTNRSKRKMHHFDNNTVTVSLADGKASFQMVLPMSEILFDVAGAIEQQAPHHSGFLPRQLCNPRRP